MIRRFLLLFVVLAPSLGSLACAQPATQAATARAFPTTQPFPGITYRHDVRENPRLHMHIVTVDLSHPDVKLVVRPGGDDPDDAGTWQTILKPTSAIAAREKLDIAVNGDFFSAKDRLPLVGAYFEGNWARVSGMAMSDGRLWAAKGGRSALAVDAAGRVTIGPLAAAPPNAKQIVGGGSMVLVQGKVTIGPDAPAPRTGVGIDPAGRRLVLLVVDGRRPGYSAGISQRQLGEELLKLGCSEGLNLDGGGSTTLVMRDRETDQWQILNRPSDGNDAPLPMSVERPVANVLGVIVESAER